MSQDEAGTAKVEITVADHTIVCEGGEPVAELADLAMRLFRETIEPALSIPVGFAAGAADAGPVANSRTTALAAINGLPLPAIR